MFPDQFLKGIPNQSFIGNDNGPTSDLFYFNESHQKHERDDEYIEQSINWRDDLGADEVLFSQKKDGVIQFKGGTVVMCRKEFDNIAKKPLMRGLLKYERSSIDGNKYHGNLLLKRSVQKREMKKIAATIANVCFLEIISNPKIK